MKVNLLASVCATSLKLDGIVRELIGDSCVLEFLHTTYQFSEL